MYFDPDTQGVGHAINRPAVAEGKAKRRKNLFGRPDLAAVYYKARDLIVENGIFRMVSVSELGDGVKSIVICNLWRIDRYPDGSVKTLEFLLNEQRWGEVTTLEYWPNVPFFPVHKTQSLAWWRDIARAAIWKALMAAGYGELPKSLTPFPDVYTYEDYETIVDKMRSRDSSLPRPEMPPQKMAYALIGRYLGKKTKYDEAKSEYLWSTGFLKPEVMVASTWGSLLRACDDWHERVAIENVERSIDQNLMWESLVPETVIDDIVVTPLNSSREVALEGYRQHHCVGGYAQDCASGYYCIYTVIEPDGTRSTLGLWLESGGKWSIEQHRGKFNGGISPPARSAGEKLLWLYQKAYREQISKTKVA